MGSGKGGGQTIGYWYDMDMLATLCHGKVNTDTDFELVELRWGDRTGWTGSVTTSSSISVYKKELFGGETREGGVNGQIDVMMGTLNQPVNEFMGTSMRRSGIAGPVPAYRGEFSLFFRGVTPVNPEFPASGVFTQVATTPPSEIFSQFFGKAKPEPVAFRWSAMNPYFKAFKVRLRRYWKGWYSAKARIGNYANPAHIIVECLTNSEWGMGYPLADLDDTRNRAAADLLYNESFGLGLVWRQQTTIQDFIGLVTQHINAVVNQDRTTGKIFLRMIRNDYDVEDLIELNPFNSTLESYSRPGFGETVNEVTIKYVTTEGQDDSVTVQDIANITSQGQIISQTIEMPGIHDPVMAARIAQRELESRSRPICKITLVTNRVAFNLYEGECFLFSWPDHGIDQMVCRAVDVNLGNLQDNRITIEAVEDVFGMPLTSFVNPQPGGWIDPSNAPAASPLRYITETPYYDLARLLTAADLAQLDPTDCYMDVYATPPSRDALDYRLWTASGSADVELRGTGSHTAVATLTVAAVPEEFSTFTVDNVADIIAEMTSETFYLVINGEYVRLDNYNATLQTFTVARGVLDTVPKSHAVGSKLMIGDQSIGRDSISYAPGEVAKVRVQTRTSRGMLDISSTPQDTYTFTQRQYRPYPPARVRLNGASYPSKLNGLVTIGFATRNRLLQTAEMIAQDVTSISPEVNQSSRLVVKGEGSVPLIDLVTVSTSYNLTFDDERVSNVTDAAGNRILRVMGFGAISSTMATNLATQVFVKIDGGYAGFEATGSRYVDATTGALTVKTLGTTAWETNTLASVVACKTGVYQANEFYTTIGGVTFVSSYEDYVGYALRVGPTDLATPGQASDSRPTSPIRDRRANARAIVKLVQREATIVWQAQNYADRRTLARRDFRFHVATKTNMTSGSFSTSSVTVGGYYKALLNSFDNASNPGTTGPTSVGRISEVNNDIKVFGRLGVIFGSLMYIPHRVAAASFNTSTKSVDITNILAAHIDVATQIGESTNVYSIDLDGVTSLLATRTGLVLADQVSSTVGVEVFNGSIRTIDITTSVLGSVIATIPSSAKEVRVVGDTSSSTFYVFATNRTIYRYNLAGTLLAQITLPSTHPVLNIDSPIEMFVTSGYLYFMPKMTVLSAEGESYRIEKSLSAYSTFFLNPFTGNDASGDWIPSSDPTSGVFYAKLLFDEAGSATDALNSATPRYNDVLTVELSSVRDGVASHTNHSITTPRTGWGLRWGESFGG